MEDAKRKIMTITFVSVLAIVVLLLGTTIAYFSATASNNRAVGGTTYNFSLDMNFNVIKSSTSLIPKEDNSIASIMANVNPCIDNDNYESCSLYRITLTNNGNSEVMLSYIETINSTYVTSNLKARLFSYVNSAYVPLTDSISLSSIANTQNMFKYNNINYSIPLEESGNLTLYLAIWLSEAYENQLNDQGKTYIGKIAFNSSGGAELSSAFTVG